MLIGEINKIGSSTIIISILVPLLPAVARFMQRPTRSASPLGHSRRLALSRASVVDASPSSRMALLATSLYRAGVVIVGA
jgi:hypothetical protein